MTSCKKRWVTTSHDVHPISVRVSFPIHAAINRSSSGTHNLRHLDGIPLMTSTTPTTPTYPGEQLCTVGMHACLDANSPTYAITCCWVRPCMKHNCLSVPDACQCQITAIRDGQFVEQIRIERLRSHLRVSAQMYHDWPAYRSKHTDPGEWHLCTVPVCLNAYRMFMQPTYP